MRNILVVHSTRQGGRLIIPVARIVAVEEIPHDSEIYRNSNARCWIEISGREGALTVIDEFEKIREQLATDPV